MGLKRPHSPHSGSEDLWTMSSYIYIYIYIYISQLRVINARALEIDDGLFFLLLTILGRHGGRNIHKLWLIRFARGRIS